MLHVLIKKSKSKSHQRFQRNEVPHEAKEIETKSAAQDPLKFRCKKDTSMRILSKDRQFSGPIRTRSTSSRRSCSAMVTFESIKPTQIWQASASPSPPITSAATEWHDKTKRPVDNLTLSMITQITDNNQLLSLSTGDEDDMSDSTDDAEGREGNVDKCKRVFTSSSHRIQSSLSSSESSSSFEMPLPSSMPSRHRQKKQSSRRHRRENLVFSSGSCSTSSTSSSSSTSADEYNGLDLSWKVKTGGTMLNSMPIQSTPQLKRAPHHHQQYLVFPPGGTPQVMPRCHFTHHFNRPQTLNLSSNAFSHSMPFQSPLKDAPIVQTIVRAIEDFFPTLEWIEKYKVLRVHQGDVLRIIIHPGTNPDMTSPTTGWFLAQKWCTDHGSGTGPIGFVPRILCSLVCPNSTPRMLHTNPRHTRSLDYTTKITNAAAFVPTAANTIQASAEGQMSVASLMCDAPSEAVPIRGVYPSPQLGFYTPTTAASNSTIYEIEDRDSGRGPSSGSEWSSGKGGSLSGATDINVNDKEHFKITSQLPQQRKDLTSRPSSKWSSTKNYQRPASLDQQSGFNFSSVLPPPPMTLFSHVCPSNSYEKKSLPLAVPTSTTLSVSITEANGPICSSSRTGTRLYVRTVETDGVAMAKSKNISNKEGSLTSEEPGNKGDKHKISGSPQSTIVVVSSNSDVTHWEPYKTMIQVGENKLEKFTLV